MRTTTEVAETQPAHHVVLAGDPGGVDREDPVADPKATAFGGGGSPDADHDRAPGLARVVAGAEAPATARSVA